MAQWKGAPGILESGRLWSGTHGDPKLSPIWIWGLGFRVQGFRVWGLGFRV